jgi:hypothetical protein
MHSLHAVRWIASASPTVALLFTLLPATARAQVPARPQAHDNQESAAPTQAELTELRSHKLAKPVFKNAAWRTDFDAAKAEAKKNHKLLLAYFTRSYAP